MSLTFVGKNGRVYQRKFDHEDALRRKEAGETVASLAREYGVSESAVWAAISPRTKACNLRAAAARRERGRCERCGGWKHGGTPAKLCASCAMDDRATGVREHELHCFSCGEWKPDAEFPYNKGGQQRRRGRHSQCRVCQTIARRDHRRRNREAARAYERARYARRKRVAQAGAEDSAQPPIGARSSA